MEETKKALLEAAQTIVNDIDKPGKAPARRVRKATLTIAKVGKEYRKVSIEADKKTISKKA